MLCVGTTIDGFQGVALPNKSDVLRRVLHLHHVECKTWAESINATAEELYAIWNKVELPCSRIDVISGKIRALYNRYTSLQKSSYRHAGVRTNAEINFTEKCEELFDIALSGNFPSLLRF